MKLIIGRSEVSKQDIIIDTLYCYRQQGSTTALIETMNIDKDAHMVVANCATAIELSKQYSINIYRFIPIEDLPNKLIGRTGPLLFDLPAIIALARL